MAKQTDLDGFGSFLSEYTEPSAVDQDVAPADVSKPVDLSPSLPASVASEVEEPMKETAAKNELVSVLDMVGHVERHETPGIDKQTLIHGSVRAAYAACMARHKDVDTVVRKTFVMRALESELVRVVAAMEGREHGEVVTEAIHMYMAKRGIKVR